MKAFFILVALASFNFCLAQKSTTVQSFKNLAIARNIHLTLIKSSDNKVEVTDGNPEDLKIASDKGNLAMSSANGEKIKAIVYYSGSIEAITAAEGVEITGNDVIKASTCSITAAKGCEIKLNVDVNRLNLAIAAGAEATLSGSAKNFNATIASGTEVNAQMLTTIDAAVTIASGSEVSIFSTNYVKATVASGAELNIYGNPKIIDDTKTNGAEVNIIK